MTVIRRPVPAEVIARLVLIGHLTVQQHPDDWCHICRQSACGMRRAALEFLALYDPPAAVAEDAPMCLPCAVGTAFGLIEHPACAGLIDGDDGPAAYRCPTCRPGWWP